MPNYYNKVTCEHALMLPSTTSSWNSSYSQNNSHSCSSNNNIRTSQVYDLIVVTDEFRLLAEAYRGNLILHGGIAIPFSRGSGGRALSITAVWGQHQGQGEQGRLIHAFRYSWSPCFLALMEWLVLSIKAHSLAVPEWICTYSHVTN